MAFGARIYNTSGDVLIDDELPTFIVKQKGVLDAWASNYGTNNEGFYVYDTGTPWRNSFYYNSTQEYPYDPYASNLTAAQKLPNPNPWTFGYTGYCTVYGPTPLQNSFYDSDVLMFVRLRNGYKLRYAKGLVPKGRYAGMAGFWSTDPQLEYALVQARNRAPNPTGFGMAVYNSAGQCMWDAESALGYIADGRTFLPWKTPLVHAVGDEWVCVELNTMYSAVPNSYNGSRSTYVDLSIKATSATTIEMVEDKRESVGNSGGQTQAEIGTSILVGRF